MNNQTNDRKTSQLLANLNKRALMLVEIYDYYEHVGEDIDKEKIDLLTDQKLEDLHSHCMWEMDQFETQEEKDIKNGLYGEEY